MQFRNCMGYKVYKFLLNRSRLHTTPMVRDFLINYVSEKRVYMGSSKFPQKNINDQGEKGGWLISGGYQNM